MVPVSARRAPPTSSRTRPRRNALFAPRNTGQLGFVVRPSAYRYPPPLRPLTRPLLPHPLRHPALLQNGPAGVHVSTRKPMCSSSVATVCRAVHARCNSTTPSSAPTARKSARAKSTEPLQDTHVANAQRRLLGTHAPRLAVANGHRIAICSPTPSAPTRAPRPDTTSAETATFVLKANSAPTRTN